MKKSFFFTILLAIVLTSFCFTVNVHAQNQLPRLMVHVYQAGHCGNCQTFGYGQNNAYVWIVDGDGNTVLGPGYTDGSGNVYFQIPGGFSYGTYTIKACYPPPPNNDEIGSTTWNYQGGSPNECVCLIPNQK